MDLTPEQKLRAENLNLRAALLDAQHRANLSVLAAERAAFVRGLALDEAAHLFDWSTLSVKPRPAQAPQAPQAPNRRGARGRK